MKKTKVLLFVIIIAFCTNIAEAQYYEKNGDKKSSIREKIFFGGGLGLQFGNVTAIDISPIIGYRITDKLQAGIGLSYSYYKYRDYNISASTYSASVFSRYFILSSLFAHAEVEALNTKIFTSYNPVDGYRKWVDSYLIGGGYFQKIGVSSGMYIMVLWNLNQNEFTPYSNPVVRIGFSF